jgi:hypothetical protein
VVLKQQTITIDFAQSKKRNSPRFSRVVTEKLLVTINAKFNITIRKQAKRFEIVLANIEDAINLIEMLKTRSSLFIRSDKLRLQQIYARFLNFAARLAISVAIAPAATPPSMLTTAKPNEHD